MVWSPIMRVDWLISYHHFSIILSFEDAENTISRFIEFYNDERLHSAIDYKAPREAYEKWKENIIEGSA